MVEQQTRPLADIVAEAQERFPLTFTATRENQGENGERDTLHFLWRITWSRKYPGGVVFESGEWSCGSAVPFFQNHGLGGDVSLGQLREARRKVRETYVPSMATVIESLLIDYSSASEHADGWAWAEECGYGEGSRLSDIRRIVEAHPTALRHGRFLAEWFGDLFDAALQAALEG